MHICPQTNQMVRCRELVASVCTWHQLASMLATFHLAPGRYTPTTVSQHIYTSWRSKPGSCDVGLADLVSQEGAGKQVAAALASTDPVVRMRAVSLVFGLAGQSQSAMEAVQQSGADPPSATTILYACHCLMNQSD